MLVNNLKYYKKQLFHKPSISIVIVVMQELWEDVCVS